MSQSGSLKVIPTGFEPGKNSLDAIENEGGTYIGTQHAKIIGEYPELLQLINIWPELNEVERHNITAYIAERRSGARSLPPTASQSTPGPKASTPSLTSQTKENPS